MNPWTIVQFFTFVVAAILLISSLFFYRVEYVPFGTVIILLATGYVFRNRFLPALLFLAYVYCLIKGNPPYDTTGVILFGVFSLFPFFVCFDIMSSNKRNTIPLSAFGIFFPVFISPLSFLLSSGAILSSAEFLTPQGLFLFTLSILLAVMISIPLIVKVWSSLNVNRT